VSCPLSVPRRHQQILLIAIAHGGSTPDIQPPNTSLPTHAHTHTYTHTHTRTHTEGDELYKRFGHRNSECSLTSQHNIRDSIIIIITIFNNAMINFIYITLYYYCFSCPDVVTRTRLGKLCDIIVIVYCTTLQSQCPNHTLSLTRTHRYTVAITSRF